MHRGIIIVLAAAVGARTSARLCALAKCDERGRSASKWHERRQGSLVAGSGESLPRRARRSGTLGVVAFDERLRALRRAKSSNHHLAEISVSSSSPAERRNLRLPHQ